MTPDFSGNLLVDVSHVSHVSSSAQTEPAHTLASSSAQTEAEISCSSVTDEQFSDPELMELPIVEHQVSSDLIIISEEDILTTYR